MSYANDSSAIKSVLSGLGYKELEGNLDLMGEGISIFMDLGFTLKAGNIDTRHLTNKNQLYSVLSELNIAYAIRNNSEYDAAVDSFKTAINALANYHYGFAENPTIERHPDNTNYAVGKAILYIGVEQC
jgi:hypothetical protein